MARQMDSSIKRLFLTPIRPDVDHRTIKNHFAIFGRAVEATNRKDYTAFVYCSSLDEANKITTKTDGTLFMGRRLKVELARVQGKDSEGFIETEKLGVCYQFNYPRNCERSSCPFRHICRRCLEITGEESHHAADDKTNCPNQTKHYTPYQVFRERDEMAMTNSPAQNRTEEALSIPPPPPPPPPPSKAGQHLCKRCHTSFRTTRKDKQERTCACEMGEKKLQLITDSTKGTMVIEKDGEFVAEVAHIRGLTSHPEPCHDSVRAILEHARGAGIPLSPATSSDEEPASLVDPTLDDDKRPMSSIPNEIGTGIAGHGDEQSAGPNCTMRILLGRGAAVDAPGDRISRSDSISSHVPPIRHRSDSISSPSTSREASRPPGFPPSQSQRPREKLDRSKGRLSGLKNDMGQLEEQRFKADKQRHLPHDLSLSDPAYRQSPSANGPPLAFGGHSKSPSSFPVSQRINEFKSHGQVVSSKHYLDAPPDFRTTESYGPGRRQDEAGCSRGGLGGSFTVLPPANSTDSGRSDMRLTSYGDSSDRISGIFSLGNSSQDTMDSRQVEINSPRNISDELEKVNRTWKDNPAPSVDELKRYMRQKPYARREIFPNLKHFSSDLKQFGLKNVVSCAPVYRNETRENMKLLGQKPEENKIVVGARVVHCMVRTGVDLMTVKPLIVFELGDLLDANCTPITFPLVLLDVYIQSGYIALAMNLAAQWDYLQTYPRRIGPGDQQRKHLIFETLMDKALVSCGGNALPMCLRIFEILCSGNVGEWPLLKKTKMTEDGRIILVEMLNRNLTGGDLWRVVKGLDRSLHVVTGEVARGVLVRLVQAGMLKEATELYKWDELTASGTYYKQETRVPILKINLKSYFSLEELQIVITEFFNELKKTPRIAHDKDVFIDMKEVEIPPSTIVLHRRITGDKQEAVIRVCQVLAAFNPPMSVSIGVGGVPFISKEQVYNYIIQ